MSDGPIQKLEPGEVLAKGLAPGRDLARKRTAEECRQERMAPALDACPICHAVYGKEACRL